MAPLGFKWQGEKPHRALTVSKHSILVKLIFKEYFRLKSLGKIQKLLKEKGIKTTRGKDFSRQAILNILKNSIYIPYSAKKYCKFQLNPLSIEGLNEI
ncbi:recombinase family protein [Candidatus Aerophobetes bacterium]|nr:recombinase family protein [Candidatus Aerophobetes bacterium]